MSETAAARRMPDPRWCPRCQQWGMPHERTGLCLWCDSPMQDEPAGNVGREETHTMTAVTASTSTRCKVEGCDGTPLQSHGRYAKLCSKHLAERKRAENADGGSASSTAATHVDEVRALLKPARALDQAAAKLAKLPTNENARAELAEAMRHVTASATPANLERLAKATKGLSRDQPKRKRLQDTYDAALRTFKSQVARLARELADA